MPGKQRTTARQAGRMRTTKACQNNIKALYLQGYTLREIARKTKKGRSTVRKVVNLPDMQNFVEAEREKLAGLAETALESIEYALEHETDGRLAQQYYERFGVYPQQAPKNYGGQTIDATQAPRQQVEGEESETAKWVAALTLTSIERAKVFGTKMPEMEEIMAELKIEIKP